MIPPRRIHVGIDRFAAGENEAASEENGRDDDAGLAGHAGCLVDARRVRQLPSHLKCSGVVTRPISRAETVAGNPRVVVIRAAENFRQLLRAAKCDGLSATPQRDIERHAVVRGKRLPVCVKVRENPRVVHGLDHAAEASARGRARRRLVMTARPAALPSRCAPVFSRLSHGVPFFVERRARGAKREHHQGGKSDDCFHG